jgi:hypothetical protein
VSTFEFGVEIKSQIISQHKTKTMFTRIKSSNSFDIELEKCFHQSIDLTSVFDLFTELSEMTPNDIRQSNIKQIKKLIDKTENITSNENQTKQTSARSNAKRHHFRKTENFSDQPSAISKDNILLLKCDREMINNVSFLDCADMLDMRENLHHSVSFSEYSDDEISIGTDFSCETIDSIEYTRARLPHICNHSDCAD